jgi:hypothetical protein
MNRSLAVRGTFQLFGSPFAFRTEGILQIPLLLAGEDITSAAQPKHHFATQRTGKETQAWNG